MTTPAEIARQLAAVDLTRDQLALIAATPAPTLTPAEIAAERDHLTALAATNVARAKADNTRRAYASDWRLFETWCAARSLVALPAEAETVALWVSHCTAQGHKASTIHRRLSSLRQAHRRVGLHLAEPEAVIRDIIDGHERARVAAAEARGERGTRQARALTAGDVIAILATTPATSTKAKRDRLLLVVGWQGILRRSELVALQVGDVEVDGQDLVITIGRSKTDQQGRGETRRLICGDDVCAADLLADWLTAVGITNGPLFRPVNKAGRVAEGAMSDRAVPLILKELATRAGIDTATVSGHSLRRGGTTAAARAGASTADIRHHGRWSPTSTVVLTYIDAAATGGIRQGL